MPTQMMNDKQDGHWRLLTDQKDNGQQDGEHADRLGEDPKITGGPHKEFSTKEDEEPANS